MGSLKLTLRLSTCSSLLLWSAAPLLLPLRLRPSQRPRLMLTTPMPMVLTHMPMVLMLMELTHTPMVTTERDLLRLNQRLMLMLTTDTHMATDHMDTEPTDMDTHTDTTERDPLMLSQRLRLMLTTDTHTDTDHTDTDTHTDTTERDLLMLSQRPRLMPLSCTEPTDMVPTHMLESMVDTELMDTHTPMVPTDHTLMVLTEESGDKHLKSSVQIRSSKQTSITNDAQFPIFNFGEGFCHELPIKLFKNQ